MEQIRKRQKCDIDRMTPVHARMAVMSMVMLRRLISSVTRSLLLFVF